ncbi:hypothetical protein D9756_009200 [Leucocoprinus leucothites]|uniref:Urea carboxylase n=1 Tax=Leucocoprinus leucothites TaxID=201217 RepID=A0A8H5CZ31_9AGAR|nr:hypothetical protein D9756_009200 [Leucoagaricus leucothites]
MPMTTEGIDARHTLLVANRGEIAVRIIRTAKKIGLRTVSVYTPADANSPQVTMADVSVVLPLSSSDSTNSSSVTESAAYLCPGSFIQICKEHDVTLLHPGYGFLSENAEFAEMVIAAGVTWLGPSPSIIRAMGLKHEARKIVQDVANSSSELGTDLQVVPGSEGLVKNAEEAEEVRGGGGLGMVVCEQLGDVKTAFENAARRAGSLFGDAGIFVERYFPKARHIEIQVFGDGKGNVVHFGERECSIQRRHQKIIEESPSPFLESRPELRVKMCAATVALCRSIQYESAGTVEFLVDDLTGNFYFLEMNTRIQVEHPVTETIYSGLDLVAMMIQHGMAKRDEKQSSIDFSQSTYDQQRQAAEISGRGHAIEGRVYAENPAEEFIPCPGLLQNVRLEENLEWLRVDTWVSTGMQITPHFDPLLAKIIVYGRTREEAISRFTKSLENCQVHGPPNNMEYLQAIMLSSEYRAGQTTTFLDKFHYAPCAVKVVSAGLDMSIQDLPGRTLGKGIPQSGPMDPIAFSIGNILVGNERNTEGIEIIVIPGMPACFRFMSATEVAITGRNVTVLVDDVEVGMWSRVSVRDGGTLRITAKPGDNRGLRTYLLIKGGFPNVPLYLGSKSTSLSIGGYQGRPLMAGDFLTLRENHFGSSSESSGCLYTLPPEILPQYHREWVVHVLPGPHDDEEFVTEEGVAKFYSTRWQVSPSSNRMGIRLEGTERIQWARDDGGQGGAHPSNILDNGYVIGSVNVNGDTPVLLTNEGPDMGGYVCLCTVATGELWKLGQLSPGCTVQFRRISHDAALGIREQNDRYLATIESLVSSQGTNCQESLFANILAGEDHSPRLAEISADGREPLVLRQAGDMGILAEFGRMELDFFTRARVQAFLEELKARNVVGLKRLSPCVRSLMIHYEPRLISQSKLLQELLVVNEDIPSDLSNMSFHGRRITFPIVLDDPWSQDATQRYMRSIRETAVYLPSNVDYLSRNNGIPSTSEMLKRLVSSDWIVFGVGFYLGCPFLVPLDPRSRLVGQKLNPSRTFTPRGAVGIAGTVAAIYPIESPGGYQLFGRSLPAWQTWGKGKDFSPDTPWLLEPFDQVRFEPVDIQTYEKLERTFDQGRYGFKVEPEILSMQQYTASVSAIQDEIATFLEHQRTAAVEQAARERRMLLEWEQHSLSRRNELQDYSARAGDPNLTTINATLFASVGKICCMVGQTIVSTQEPLLVLSAMKSEVEVKPHPEHVGKIVKAFGRGIQIGALVKPGDSLIVL